MIQASQCDNFDLDWGNTESFERLRFGLQERDVSIVDAYTPGVDAPVVVTVVDARTNYVNISTLTGLTPVGPTPGLFPSLCRDFPCYWCSCSTG